MMHRVVIDFVVDIPNADIANDIQTRVAEEHNDKLCELLQSITGYTPMRTPQDPGLYVGTEPVKWSSKESDWVDA